MENEKKIAYSAVLLKAASQRLGFISSIVNTQRLDRYMHTLEEEAMNVLFINGDKDVQRTLRYILDVLLRRESLTEEEQRFLNELLPLALRDGNYLYQQVEANMERIVKGKADPSWESVRKFYFAEDEVAQPEPAQEEN